MKHYHLTLIHRESKIHRSFAVSYTGTVTNLFHELMSHLNKSYVEWSWYDLVSIDLISEQEYSEDDNQVTL